jgi:methylated-DNA-[protein]-cysteine S-methyltransferase
MAQLFNISIMEQALMYIDYINTQLGLMECKASDKGLIHVIFCGNETSKAKPNLITTECLQQLSEYFSGGRTTFDLPLDPNGTTFQKQVWTCLSTIEFGQTVSYGDIAHMVGKPKAAQAVGGANGRNPLTIVVPCHRVVGATGTLTGYAGGIERKLWLLRHEGIAIAETEQTEHLDISHVINTRQSKTQYLK